MSQIAMEFVDSDDRDSVDQALAMVGKRAKYLCDGADPIEVVVAAVTFHDSAVSSGDYRVTYSVQLDNAIGSVIRFIKPESLKVLP